MRHPERFVTAYADFILCNPAPDAIVAPANSGTVMVEIARLVHNAVRVQIPPSLVLPIFTTYWFPGITDLPYDNAALLPLARAFFSHRPSHNLLFLDDEIGHGQSLNTALTLVRDATPPTSNRSCAIIAEGNGLTWEYPFEGMRTTFLPFAIRPNPDVSGILIDELIDDRYVRAFETALERPVMKKEIACLLFDQPLKMLNGKISALSHGALAMCKTRMPDFDARQARFRQELTDAVFGIVRARS